MRPVKSQTRPDTPLERRLRQVRAILGHGKELPLVWLADMAQIPRSTLKNAARRDSLTYDLAQAIARLFADREGLTITWLREGIGMAPERPKRAPGGPPERRSAAAGGTPLALERRMRAERAALAFQRTIEDAELYGGDAGGWVLHDVLIELATLLAKHGAPNADLLDYAEELRSELKPRS